MKTEASTALDVGELRNEPYESASSCQATVRICLLGRFEVWADDQPVIDHRWHHRKAKTLVKLLAVQRDCSLNREQALDIVWPDLDADAARNNLRKSLYHLRMALTAHGVRLPLILLRDNMVALSDDVWLDIAEFRRQAQAARTSPASREAYEQALALYRGDLLMEDLYEDWTRARRDELQDLRNELLSGLSKLCEERGQLGPAREHLQSLLQLDPLDEGAHRSLMRVYARSGSRHKAERQYRACRDILKRELGVDPSQETEILHREILDGKAPAIRYSA